MSTNRLTAAWIGMAAGPACWFAQLLAANSLAAFACVEQPWLLDALGGACALILVGAIAAASGARRRGMRTKEPRTTEGSPDLLELMGVLMPSLFLVAVIWQLAASLLFPPCDR